MSFWIFIEKYTYFINNLLTAFSINHKKGISLVSGLNLSVAGLYSSILGEPQDMLVMEGR